VWNEAGLEGHTVYRGMGCNSCHRALGVGEVGVAPVLDGVGTRRTLEWLESYLKDPESLVPGTAHNGSFGPDFRELEESERSLLAAFLFALKANPGSPNYPGPPLQVLPETEEK
jgi:cytochrome c2